MAEVFDLPAGLVSSGERLVLLALADNAADEDRLAWPSVARIARKAGLSDRQTKRCLNTLVSKRLIDRIPAGLASEMLGDTDHLNRYLGHRPDKRPALYRLQTSPMHGHLWGDGVTG